MKAIILIILILSPYFYAETYGQGRYRERDGRGGPSEEAIQRAEQRRDFEDYKREQEKKEKRERQERENERWQDRIREERERLKDSQERRERKWDSGVW